MEAAKMAGVDFIINVVVNPAKRITKIVTGDLEEAWLSGVEFCRKIRMVPIREQFDIVVTSPGGYPRDIDLFQSQKAISPAEIATRPGGHIILVAECRDGVGSTTGTYYRWLEEAGTPAEVIERFEKEGWTEASSKAYMFARAMEKFKITVVTDRLKPEKLRNIFLDHAFSVDEAIEKALIEMGKPVTICILPKGSSIGITHIESA
jgi:nickel-dependent lactate racemase